MKRGGTPYIATLDTVKNILMRNNYNPNEEAGRKTLIFFITDGGPTDYNLPSNNTPENRDLIRTEIADLLNSYSYPPIHLFFINPEDPTTLTTTDIEILNNDVIEMLIGQNPDVNQIEGSHKHIDSDSDDQISGIADFIADAVDKATKYTNLTSATLENKTLDAEVEISSVQDLQLIFNGALPLGEGENEIELLTSYEILLDDSLVESGDLVTSFWLDVSGDSLTVSGIDADALFRYECP